MIENPLYEPDGERRGTARSSLYLAASLYCDGSAHPAKIRNISSTGALLESSAEVARDSLVQLVRGSLIVHGLVAWVADGKLGLKFSGSIDVLHWRKTISNSEQERIDDIVRLVKAGAVPLPINVAPREPSTEAESPSRDLKRAVKLLDLLGDRLAKDAIVVASYPAELQNLDIAVQVIEAVGALLETQTDLGVDANKFSSLRKSADQALGRAA